MCGKRHFDPATARGPAEGQTVRLTDLPHRTAGRCGNGFPWWVLWTIWPLMFLVKSTGYLLTPLVSLLNQPIMFSVTPLPLILIGAGLLILLVGLLRRTRSDPGA
jgi:hypothetical protein